MLTWYATDWTDRKAKLSLYRYHFRGFVRKLFFLTSLRDKNVSDKQTLDVDTLNGISEQIRNVKEIKVGEAHLSSKEGVDHEVTIFY